MENELRTIDFVNNVDDENTVRGYIAKFESISHDLGGFIEKIEKGAFLESLSNNKDIRALFDHDASKLLGRTKNGTLKLYEDEIGLNFSLLLPNTTLGKDIRELVKSETLTQCSFGFRVEKERWENRQNDLPLRILQKIDLRECSLVTFPAYESSEVSLRNFKKSEELMKQREIDLLKIKRLKLEIARRRYNKY